MILTAAFLLLAPCVLSIEAEEEKFCQCDLHHVYCDAIQNGYESVFDAFPQSDGDRRLILGLFNGYRNASAGGELRLKDSKTHKEFSINSSSNMLQLRYNYALEKAAKNQNIYCQEIVRELNDFEWCKHSCDKCLDLDGIEIMLGSKGYFEPIEMKSTTVIQKIIPHLIFSNLNAFTSPLLLKNFSTVGSGGVEDYLAVALNSQFSEVGCSITYYDSPFHNSRKLGLSWAACAFGPATALPGKPAFRYGQACSECPETSLCSSEYSNLCQLSEGDIPFPTSGLGHRGDLCHITSKSPTDDALISRDIKTITEAQPASNDLLTHGYTSPPSTVERNKNNQTTSSSLLIGPYSDYEKNDSSYVSATSVFPTLNEEEMKFFFDTTTITFRDHEKNSSQTRGYSLSSQPLSTKKASTTLVYENSEEDSNKQENNNFNLEEPRENSELNNPYQDVKNSLEPILIDSWGNTELTKPKWDQSTNLSDRHGEYFSIKCLSDRLVERKGFKALNQQDVNRKNTEYTLRGRIQ